MFENLIRVSMNELNKMDLAYAGKEEFSDTDAKRFDMVAHGLSCLMKSLPFIEEYGYDQEEGMSGRRGRGSNGRYVSRESDNGMSGHYWPGQQMPPPMWSGTYRGYPPEYGYPYSMR